MQDIIIFGSTGSIGKNALDVIRQQKEKFRVLGLVTLQNVKTLYQQIKEFKPRYVAVQNLKACSQLKKILPQGVTLFSQEQGIEEFSELKADISIMAIAGISCLKPLLINMKNTKKIALANKESIVVGGDFVFEKARRNNTKIVPVDSEISSIFQLLENKEKNDIDKIYITASGGALFDYNKKDLAKVTVKNALAHPTWSMGKRISIDSATLVNKGFEVIETKRFFDIAYEKIEVIIHRESIIHALVKFIDNTFFSCMYDPDMRLPISYALSYPKRFNFCPSQSMPIESVSKVMTFNKDFSISFKPLDSNKFPLFNIILEAAKREDNSLVILNAADEVAIECFLAGKIKFTDIYKIMENIFTHYPKKKINKLEDIFFWDNWARNKIKGIKIRG